MDVVSGDFELYMSFFCTTGARKEINISHDVAHRYASRHCQSL